MTHHHVDLARTTLGVLFIGSLTLASFWILRPFLPAFIEDPAVIGKILGHLAARGPAARGPPPPPLEILRTSEKLKEPA